MQIIKGDPGGGDIYATNDAQNIMQIQIDSKKEYSLVHSPVHFMVENWVVEYQSIFFCVHNQISQGVYHLEIQKFQIVLHISQESANKSGWKLKV